ncbi:hypothetical protein BD413DRAFT_613846 [Trametes elegans]|nr:hypothetical protein BD413DRAFT_613846 [Trametes elegans]
MGKDVFKDQSSVTAIAPAICLLGALSSPPPGGPKALFVSSISTILHYPADEPAPESLDFGPDIAVGMCYGESKWVTKQIYSRAAEATGLHTTSVRVGQLSGDTRIGEWTSAKSQHPGKAMQCQMGFAYVIGHDGRLEFPPAVA